MALIITDGYRLVQNETCGKTLRRQYSSVISMSLAATRCRLPRLKGFSLFVVLFLLILPAFSVAETSHQVYFKGTDSELDVFHIKGREPGPTLLLVGGIQGNATRWILGRRPLCGTWH